MPKTTTYKFTLSIGYPSANREDEMTVEQIGYDEQEWADLSKEDKDSELQEAWNDWSTNYIEGGWETI